MYPSSVEKPNRYTIGKYLRKKKGLKQTDPSAQIQDPPESLSKYISYLVENGVGINKLAFSQFRLKNNLPYSGLIATQKIITDEILLKVPKTLLLNTKKAYFSELRPIFLENPKFFSSYYTSSWEDHMLLMFILKEYSKGESSEFYHMIANLPHDIDYVVFWTDEELALLEDPILTRLAKDHRKCYDEEEREVLKLVEKYPDILDASIYTKENIRWAYTHLVTRCFGKYLEYVSLIPFAELFNHECVDVYYDLEYYPENPDIPKDYKMEEPNEVNDEDVDDFKTSEGSNESEDEEFDSDFEYEKEGIEGESENSESLSTKLHGLPILDEIRMKGDDIEHQLINELDWGDGFTIFFVKEVYKETLDILDKYKSKEMDLASSKNLLMNLETAVIIYKNEVRKFYKKVCKIEDDQLVPKQKKSFIKQAEEKENKDNIAGLENKPASELFDADEEWREDTFDNFVMKASWKDQFQAGSQVFFCYGRLSNRTALLRYGMALEYNKYEHIHMKIPYFKYIKDVEWLANKIKYFKMSRYMRFKLKRTKINIPLINFCKGLFFKMDYADYERVLKPIDLDMEIRGVEKAYEFLQEYLDSFSKKPEENRQMLRDPKLGYHEYFAAVYRLERQRILIFHSKALLVVLEILKRLKKGLSLDFAVMRVHDLETKEECNRNRIFIADYLDQLKAYAPSTFGFE